MRAPLAVRTRRRRARARATVAALAAVPLVLAGCSAGDDADGPRPTVTTTVPERPNPLLGASLWTNPASTASWAERTLRDSGDEQAADSVARIAAVPTATWVTGGYDPKARVEELTVAAQAAGQVPVLVAYNLPERDCGQYSRGGAGSPAEYLAWTREVVAGLGDRPAVVVVEPDAIAHAIVGCDGARMATDRYELLAKTVDLYAEAPSTAVYLDAGNSGWVTDASKVAEALDESGVRRTAGFSLNVSNFEPTDAAISYGRAVSRNLGGGVSYVVDTSRNGAPVDGGDWCNPWTARLGERPSTETGLDEVDALLWIKQPGDSDGTCKPGAPPAGMWWQALADSLLQTA